MCFSVNRIDRNAIQTTNIYGNSTVNVTIVNNTIVHADDTWLSVTNFHKIEVSHNIFGTFGSITLKSDDQIECNLGDNILLNNFERYPNFGNQNCTFKPISKKHCQCELRRTFHNETQIDELNMVNCLVDENVQNCNRTKNLSAPELLSNICNKTKRYADCANVQRTPRTQRDVWCHEKGLDIKLIAIIVGVVGLFIVPLIAFIVIRNRVSSRSATFSPEHDTILISPKSSSCSVNDQIIIRQTLHDMRDRYPTDLYNQVFNNTVQILNNVLSQAELAAAIDRNEITLLECQQFGGDFNEFRNVLKRQIEPTVKRRSKLARNKQNEDRATYAVPPTR